MLRTRLPETPLRAPSTRSPCKVEGRCTLACVTATGRNRLLKVSCSPLRLPQVLFLIVTDLTISLKCCNRADPATSQLLLGKSCEPVTLLQRPPSTSPSLWSSSRTVSSSKELLEGVLLPQGCHVIPDPEFHLLKQCF